MKQNLILLSCILLVPTIQANLRQGDKFDSLTISDGRTFNQVEIREVLPDGLKIIHDAGAATIKAEMLPDEIRARGKFLVGPALESHRQEKDSAKQAARERADAELIARNRAVEAAKAEREAAVKAPRIVSAEDVMRYWVRSFPLPRTLDPQYHQKMRAYKTMLEDIRAGHYDNFAAEQALRWNISEYQRVGDLPRAESMQNDLAMLHEKVHREKMEEAARAQAEANRAIYNELRAINQELRNLRFDVQDLNRF